MKKYLPLLLIFLFPLTVNAQINPMHPNPLPGEGNVAGGLGLNWIDGELYYTFHFTPEIAFANFGVGLDLNLDFNKEGKLRKENFNEFSDYLSIIRYVRYGMKHDPVFVKLGALDYYTLGHGSIMYQYNNSPSLDSRKNGLVFDIDFGQFGFESIYSQFAIASVVGVRGYVRPLKFTPAGQLPIIGNLEVGATYASDFNKHAGILNGHYDPADNKFVVTKDEGNVNIVGMDIGLPVLSSSLLSVNLYADYAKIINFGSGVSTGIILESSGLGLVNASVKLERRFNNDKFIPAYFNSMYEVERFAVDTSNSTFHSKIQRLNAMTNADNGYYGELNVNVLGLFDILGSYQRLDKDPKSGILHMTTQIAPENVPYVVRAGYDKVHIQDEKDLFTLDDRSYLYFEFGYKPLPYLLVSMLYNWTFTPVRDASDNIIDYKPQKRIEPRVSFIYPFNFGGQ